MIFLTFGQLCYGQNKKSYLPLYANGDTILWFKLQQEKLHKAGLKDLTKTKEKLHFRLSSETQAIDIWTTDQMIFWGTLTNFTTSYNTQNHQRKRPNKEKFFSTVTKLDTSNARRIYDLFMKKSIFDIPPQDSIKDWTGGLDGTTYFIEQSTSDHYSFKEYWTPDLFKDKVDEAKRINELTLDLEVLLNLTQSFDQFIHSLPYGTYNAGGDLILTTSD